MLEYLKKLEMKIDNMHLELKYTREELDACRNELAAARLELAKVEENLDYTIKQWSWY